MIKTPLLIAFALACTFTALAEDPAKPAEGGRRPGLNPEERLKQMKEQLNLTDEQTAKIKEVFEKNRDKMKELRDDTALSQEDRRAKFRELMQGIQQEIAPILTPEQQTKWREEIAKRRAGQAGKAPAQ